MPITKDETSFIFEPELPEGLSRKEKKEVLDEIGGLIVTEILTYVSQGNSPVSGYKKFKPLNKKYADDKKNGNRLANLDLESDMLSSLTYKVVGESVVIGIFDDDQAIKSYNHNVGDTLPQRKFIPDEDEKLKRAITSQIDSIIDEVLGD